MTSQQPHNALPRNYCTEAIDKRLKAVSLSLSCSHDELARKRRPTGSRLESMPNPRKAAQSKERPLTLQRVLYSSVRCLRL